MITIDDKRFPDLYDDEIKMIFVDENAPDLDINDWVRLGQPYIWQLRHVGDRVNVYFDQGYGYIMMEDKDWNECYMDKDMVSTKDGNVVAFGSYYDGKYITFMPYYLSGSK